MDTKAAKSLTSVERIGRVTESDREGSRKKKT